MIWRASGSSTGWSGSAGHRLVLSGPDFAAGRAGAVAGLAAWAALAVSLTVRLGMIFATAGVRASRATSAAEIFAATAFTLTSWATSVPPLALMAATIPC